MGDLGLSIAATGMNAAMTNIDVTTENIANAQTAGYVSESAQLAALPGTGGVGDGVEVTTIAQATSAMLSANNYQAQGTLSSMNALQQVLTGIENIFPLGQSTASSTTSSNSSLAGQLSGFWSAWDSLAQDPSSLAPRTTVVDDAQGMAQTISEASTQLQQLATNSTSELTTDLTQVNNLLGQAASLNQSIVAAGGATAGSNGGANQLADQLNNVLGQLTQLAGVHVSVQGNGTANISIGGISVVQGNQAATLSMTPPAGTTAELTASGTSVTSIYAYPSGASAGSIDGVVAPISGGAMSGLLTGLNQSIPEYTVELNNVATALATTVNTQLAQGYTASGASGATEPLFTSTGPMSAATIAVNSAIVADPTLIAAAGATQTVTAAGAITGGTVTTPETLTIAQGTATATYTTTAGEGISDIAAGLNAQFAASGLSLAAVLVNSGTTLSITGTGTGTAAFTVSSTAVGAGTTELGGAAANTAVASAAGPLGANDASNAQAMAELGTSSTGPDLAYQNLVEGIGSDVQNANSQLAGQQSVATQAQQALTAITGVNTDTQLTALMNFQNTYEANAKVVSVIDTTIQSLLAAV